MSIGGDQTSCENAKARGSEACLICQQDPLQRPIVYSEAEYASLSPELSDILFGDTPVVTLSNFKRCGSRDDTLMKVSALLCGKVLLCFVGEV